MTEDGDIKDLLGRAIGPEPPLALDRGAVFQRGRRKVRLRRFAASGGVAASVLVVLVGVAVITGWPEQDSQEVAAPPAVTPTSVPVPTTSEIAPAGPQLPLTTSRAPSGLEPVATDDHAQVLTKAFAEANVIPSGFRVQAVPNTSRPPLVFTHYGGNYLAVAELVDPLGTGTLTISVGWHPPGSPPASCAEWSPVQPISCTVIDDSGVPVRVGSFRDATGRITYEAHAERPGVTSVFVGMTSAAAAPAKPNARPKPPLELEVLARIAVLPRLTYS
jgi:hypothetical protein